MKRSLSICAVAAALAAFGSSPAAATEVVDDNRAQCPTAGHTTIQAGVDAASRGEGVQVCNGVYPEAVTIAGRAKDGVGLFAKTIGGASIVPPPGYAGPLVKIDGADSVGVKRFRIAGPFGPPCPSTREFLHGVLVDNRALSAEIQQNTISSIGDPPGTDCPDTIGGTGVEFRGLSRGFVELNVIEEYESAGVVFSDADFVAMVSNRLVADQTPIRAAVGLFLSNGSQARVVGNSISRNVEGISLFAADDENVTLSSNRVTDNGIGIRFDEQRNADLTRNIVTGNAEQGVLTDPAGSFNNRFVQNDFRGNGGIDCEDQSAGAFPSQRGSPRYTTQNLWANNKGLDASPAPICTPTGNAGPPVP